MKDKQTTKESNMAYKVGPLEHELTQLCFEARRKMGEARKAGDTAQYEYWRGKEEAYSESARSAEGYGA